MNVNSLSVLMPTPASTPTPIAAVSTPNPLTPEANAANAARSQAHPFADMLKQRQAAAPAEVKTAVNQSMRVLPTTEPVPNADANPPVTHLNASTAAKTKRAAEPKGPVAAERPRDDAKPAAGAVDKDAKDTKDGKDAIGLAKGLEPVQCPVDLGLDAVTRKAAPAAADGAQGDAAAIDGAKADAKGASWAADAQAAPAEAAERAAAAKASDPIAIARTSARDDASSAMGELVKHAAPDDHGSRIEMPTTAPASFASTLAQLNGGAPATPATVDVALATPMNAPEFAQALGAQVSMLVAGGVQQAELHLNPADMGPVSIAITLDGTQAQVDFGADLASTRHAIEAGLPALASALQDAGFTLHGGGVSQHSRQSESGQNDGGQGKDRSFAMGGRDTGVNHDTLVAAPARPRVAMTGGVDVYA